MATLKERFIQVLKQDIAQFDKMADTLESLIPHLAGKAQQDLSRAEVEVRRARAQELRTLLQMVESGN